MREGTASTSTHSSSSSAGGTGGHPMVGGLEEGEGIHDGVGRVHVRLIAAFKSRVHDAADGDHYVTASIEGLGVGSSDASPPQSFFRSQTVTSSATPVFNRQWTLPAPHYKVCITHHVIRFFFTDNFLNYFTLSSSTLCALPLLPPLQGVSAAVFDGRQHGPQGGYSTNVPVGHAITRH